ncbi:MAG: hypothetical protein KDK53_19040 [Maritimibacter sp.]|nr:hypothetical protein [Maritimibacter sp.]
MHRILILLPVILAACMAAEPSYYNGYEVAPVTRGGGWAGCEAEGGVFATGTDGGLVCVPR